MYAVIHTGGKQYKVKKGDTVQVELLPLALGAKADFQEVLLVGSGNEVKVGQPFVDAASVSAEVVAIEKGPKIIVYQKRRRKQYDKKTGHRQPYTRLLIMSIDNGAGQKEILSAEEKKTILGRVGYAAKDAWAYEPEELTTPEAHEKKAKKKTAISKRAIKARAATTKKLATKKAAPKKRATKVAKKSAKKK